MKVQYVSEDGKVFDKEQDCLNYEMIHNDRREMLLAKRNSVKARYMPKLFKAYIESKKEFNELLNGKHTVDNLIKLSHVADTYAQNMLSFNNANDTFKDIKKMLKEDFYGNKD